MYLICLSSSLHTYPHSPTLTLTHTPSPSLSQAGSPPMALSAGDFEITEVQGCDGALNERVFACTHEPKDPAKTMRVPLDVRGLAPYVRGWWG